MQIHFVWTYHYKGEANPERVPAVGALWDHDGLTVNCYHHGWSFTHGTPAHTHRHTQCPCYFIPTFTLCSKKRMKAPADEGLDALSSDWCHVHGHGLRGSEPVGVVITGCKVAYVVDIAEEEGHWTELPQTTACCT